MKLRKWPRIYSNWSPWILAFPVQIPYSPVYPFLDHFITLGGITMRTILLSSSSTAYSSRVLISFLSQCLFSSHNMYDMYLWNTVRDRYIQTFTHDWPRLMHIFTLGCLEDRRVSGREDLGILCGVVWFGCGKGGVLFWRVHPFQGQASQRAAGDFRETYSMVFDQVTFSHSILFSLF